MGDLNARVGNGAIAGIKQRFNEENINENGEALINFCAMNELRINNTFFDHKPQHKITWRNTRGQSSMIDYIISNRLIHPSQILDVRTLTSANIGSDHGLVLGKLGMTVQRRKKPPKITTEKFNIELIHQDSIRDLYKRRLSQKIVDNGIQPGDDVEASWRKIRENMEKAAEEVLGKRIVNKNNTKNITPWFNNEVKELMKEK